MSEEGLQREAREKRVAQLTKEARESGARLRATIRDVLVGRCAPLVVEHARLVEQLLAAERQAGRVRSDPFGAAGEWWRRADFIPSVVAADKPGFADAVKAAFLDSAGEAQMYLGPRPIIPVR